MSTPQVTADRLIELMGRFPSSGTLYFDGERIDYKVEAENKLFGLPGKRYTFNGRVSYVWKKEGLRDESGTL